MTPTLIVAVLMTSLVSSALTSALVVLLLPPTGLAAPEPQPPPVVQAGSFEVVDSRGAVRARLQVEGDGTVGLALSDAAGAPRALFGLTAADATRPILAMQEADGQPRLSIALSPSGAPGMVLYGRTGRNLALGEGGDQAMGLRGMNPAGPGSGPVGPGRLELSVRGDDAAGLVVADPSGQPRVVIATLADGTPNLRQVP